MANYFVNLPAAQAPRNAMYNFEPLARAVAGIRDRNRQAEIDEQNAMLAQERSRRADASLSMQEERLQLAREQSERQNKLADADVVRKGYMTVGDTIFRLPGADGGSVNAMAGSPQPVFTAPESEDDRLDRELKQGRLDKLKHEKEFGYTSKAFQQKYAAGVAAGLNDQAAAQFASGNLVIKTDPITKQPIAYDAFGRKVDLGTIMNPNAQGGVFSPGVPAPQSGPIPAGHVQQTGGAVPQQMPDQGYQSPPLPEIEPKDTLWARAPSITGFATSLGEDFSKIPAAGTQDATTMDAKSDFDVAQRKIKSVFSLSRRFPVYEQKVINDLFGRGYWTKPEVLQSKLASLDDMIKEEISVQTKIANDDRQPVEDRKEAINFINSAQALRGTLGVPAKKTPEEAKDLQPGTVYRTIDGRVMVR